MMMMRSSSPERRPPRKETTAGGEDATSVVRTPSAASLLGFANRGAAGPRGLGVGVGRRPLVRCRLHAGRLTGDCT
jgi:hypothetical protein